MNMPNQRLELSVTSEVMNLSGEPTIAALLNQRSNCILTHPYNHREEELSSIIKESFFFQQIGTLQKTTLGHSTENN